MKPHRHHALFAAVAVLAAGTLFAQAADGTQEPWEAPARAAKKKNPVPVTDASLARGREIYTKECASCHGDTGRGDGSGVKDLEVKPHDWSGGYLSSQTDGALFWKITEGRKPMPSFAENYSDEDRWNVIDYVRKLTATNAPKP